MNEFAYNFEDDFFTGSSTSALYDYGLSLTNPLTGSVASSVNSLSEIFIEWYLFDSSNPKTIEEFLETESLQDIFTPEQFISIMAGTAHIDENLCSILSHLLPFQITTKRIFALNNSIKDFTPEITCSAEAIFIKHKKILEKKKEYARQYRLEHQEKIRERRHIHYLKNKEKILFGDGYITDILCNKTFRISPQSFYQINPVGTEILYSKAIEFASLKGTETVVDAYCGIGTIGICASDKIKRLIGIEQNASAVRDANINAELNNIQNAEFFCGDSGEIMQKIENSGVKIDVVFMDPARAGADRRFLNALRNVAPEKIVYISCNPETLARDLSYLSKDYRITKIQPVDMFPMTKHIETVVLLIKNK